MKGTFPLVGVAVAVPVGIRQLDGMELIVAVIPPELVMITVCEVVQPLASVIVTE